jgi:hypothetical protein
MPGKVRRPTVPGPTIERQADHSLTPDFVPMLLTGRAGRSLRLLGPACRPAGAATRSPGGLPSSLLGVVAELATERFADLLSCPQGSGQRVDPFGGGLLGVCQLGEAGGAQLLAFVASVSPDTSQLVAVLLPGLFQLGPQLLHGRPAASAWAVCCSVSARVCAIRANSASA